jgi:hypothetical protein
MRLNKVAKRKKPINPLLLIDADQFENITQMVDAVHDKSREIKDLNHEIKTLKMVIHSSINEQGFCSTRQGIRKGGTRSTKYSHAHSTINRRITISQGIMI